MNYDVYLDIDGVLRTKELQAANYVHEFLEYVTANHSTYWLTTHCKGDPEITITRLAQSLQPETLVLAQSIKPTNWDWAKTEGINFANPFVWFDDILFANERNVLVKHGVLDDWIEVDLVNNPNQLKEYVDCFPKPKDLTN